MQKRMMEKIEELTLYVIQLQQEIEALKQKEKLVGVSMLKLHKSNFLFYLSHC